jgi:cardiolipin synthase
VFSSSPSGGSESMHLMYLLSITAATKTIDLSSAYFVPDDLTVGALVAAMKRGVRLRIIVPGDHRSKTVRSRLARGLGPAAGGGRRDQRIPADHVPLQGVITVDGLLVSVGSTNFDNRSFRLNDEANLNIYDEAFAAEQTTQFEADLRQSKRLTYEAWKDRPLHEKAMEHLSALLSSQL